MCQLVIVWTLLIYHLISQIPWEEDRVSVIIVTFQIEVLKLRIMTASFAVYYIQTISKVVSLF